MKSGKLYKIVDSVSGDTIYSCPTSTEADRVFDLIRFIKPDTNINLIVELRKV